MTTNLGPDYSDYVRNVREAAAILDRLARNDLLQNEQPLDVKYEALQRKELLDVTSFLQMTVTSLEGGA